MPMNERPVMRFCILWQLAGGNAPRAHNLTISFFSVRRLIQLHQQLGYFQPAQQFCPYFSRINILAFPQFVQGLQEQGAFMHNILLPVIYKRGSAVCGMEPDLPTEPLERGTGWRRGRWG